MPLKVSSRFLEQGEDFKHFQGLKLAEIDQWWFPDAELKYKILRIFGQVSTETSPGRQELLLAFQVDAVAAGSPAAQESCPPVISWCRGTRWQASAPAAEVGQCPHGKALSQLSATGDLHMFLFLL